MENLLIQLAIMVFVGILIGWFTNYLAIKLLFRPYKEVNFLFFKIQGLIPKNRDKISENIAETIEKELISVKYITEKLKDSDVINDEVLDKLLDKIIGEKLKKSILEKNPLLKMFLNDSLIEKIKSYFKKSEMCSYLKPTSIFLKQHKNALDNMTRAFSIYPNI